MAFDPQRDLVLERVVDLSAERIMRAWTQPDHLEHWFAPAPWTTVACEIDLRPFGLFRTVMRSPEGDEHPSTKRWALKPVGMLRSGSSWRTCGTCPDPSPKS